MCHTLVLTILFLSTLSLRRATDDLQVPAGVSKISIHALLAESDQALVRKTTTTKKFLSTLSLRRATRANNLKRHKKIQFLSTLSLRRATGKTPVNIMSHLDFYPRSPCGERPVNIQRPTAKNDFYPRSPCGERLHAPNHNPCSRSNFYPRSPCGERHLPSKPIERKLYFYPRSPCGERRCFARCRFLGLSISIHALLAESDLG